MLLRSGMNAMISRTTISRLKKLFLCSLRRAMTKLIENSGR